MVIRGGVAHWHAVTKWTDDVLAVQLERCAPGTTLSLQTTVVEQDGGAGAYADVTVGLFAEWLRSEAAAGAAAAAAAETGATAASGELAESCACSAVDAVLVVANGWLPRIGRPRSQPQPRTPRFYLSEMDDVDELCPDLLPDLAHMRPFDAILPWGTLIPFGDQLSELIGFDLSEWTGLYAPLYPVLWWGPAQTRTGLHYDIERYNLLGQVRGTKNVTFLAPDQSSFLYPSGMWDRSAVLSQISLWGPDFE